MDKRRYAVSVSSFLASRVSTVRVNGAVFSNVTFFAYGLPLYAERKPTSEMICHPTEFREC